MSRKDVVQRRSPPMGIWFALGLLLVAASIFVALGVLAWQEAAQVQVLRAELQTAQREIEVMEARMLAVQSTATAMDNRLATLEANDPTQQLAELWATVEAGDDGRQSASLRASLTEIQSQVDGFQAELDSLEARTHALEAKDSRAPEVRLTVARQRQSHNLSCESSATSMVAQYHGVELSESDVLAALPLNDNPHLGFRGNVDGPIGQLEDYGVYADPILTILNRQGLQAWPVAGGLDGIKAAIARGNPVLAWVTYDCRPGTPTTVTIDGDAVTLVPYQHVVVVTGYNSDGVWANDPWDGKEDFYTAADLKRAMSYFGDMAIEVAAP